MNQIPLLKPNLPTPEEFSPFLQASYADHHFSNFGPAERWFTTRMSVKLNAPVVCATNATIGLTALLKSVIPDGRFCNVLIPNFTFAATAHSVRLAGYNPLLLDVDEHGVIKEEDIVEAYHKDGKDIGAFIVVFPLGYSVDVSKYLRLADRLNTVCIFDAAAAFGVPVPGHLNAVYSLHATKAFGIGEGAIVTTSDDHIASRVKSCLNFGFDEEQRVVGWGINGKMSEFQAAIAGAVANNFLHSQDLRSKVRAIYESELSEFVLWNRTSGLQVFPIAVPAKDRDALSKYLTNKGISNKAYYKCIDDQPYFSRCFRWGSLSASHALSKKVLCIPFYDSLSQSEQGYIIDMIRGYFA